MAPSGGPAHRTDLIYGDRDTGGSSTYAAVAGYPSITVPAGHLKLALVTYSQDDLATDAENNLQTVDGSNVCLTAQGQACNFNVTTRTGKVSLIALLFDYDPHGTLGDSTDDTRTLIGYAARTGIEVAASVDQTGQDLQIVAPTMLALETVAPQMDAADMAARNDSYDAGVALLRSG